VRKLVEFPKGIKPWSFMARVSVMAAFFSFASEGVAEQALYPLKEGIAQPFHSSDIPNWMKLDFELRGRTEDQSSLGLVKDKDRAYELTRVWGGLTATPTNWLTFYGQFMDTHALGLPLADTASTMRDTFDLRQGYLNFHCKPVQFLVGRMELRIGDERVVGISDWTNNSRTWDGFYMRIGDKNQLNLFSTSVVTVHPTSLDAHGAGLTFHGVHAKLTTYVPNTDLEPFVLVRAEPYVKSHQGSSAARPR
jgi:Alginate export